MQENEKNVSESNNSVTKRHKVILSQDINSDKMEEKIAAYYLKT
ncbi:MAG: hypothetical protein ACJA19_001513 [Bacteroidia bacterium]|jgi:hypothetical protein|tara:strand:- start:7324 stop:7455 length:132 start_codon:yes stop_codon:yes gene_type:complete